MAKFQGAIISKLPKVETSIFAIMSQMANEHKAINLSQGFPDFPVSEQLIELVGKHMKNGANQYAPMMGAPPLLESISAKYDHLYSYKYDPNKEITVTAGATQALYTAITAFVREGDEVIVFEPAYDSYVPAIELNGGIPVYAELHAPDYQINWNELKKLVNRQTRMIIINSPHNPTGKVLSAGDLQKLEKITNNSDILILSDEVYEHIIFDGLEHQSVAKFPKLAERTLVIGSFGKTFHATGWKMGYCAAPENLTQEFRRVHQFIVFAVNHPIQLAMAEFIQNKENYQGLGAFYQKKRDFFIEALSKSRFTIEPSAGTYFQLLSFKNISSEKELDFAKRITKEFGVASIPVSVFYHRSLESRVVRFCFAKSEETLEKAAAILCKI
ncbi:MAG: methionine aminotransferase [Bacteroidetes bacterium]|nr:methionine aminotransferase [Bacteroidota bacterium]MBU1720721.1 methionine aminotransferase [Bacteroidota bacterium]